MFKNRHIQISMAKQQPSAPKGADEQDPFEDRAMFVHGLVEDLMVKGAVGVCGYVALDTVRKVLVARASK